MIGTATGKLGGNPNVLVAEARRHGGRMMVLPGQNDARSRRTQPALLGGRRDAKRRGSTSRAREERDRVRHGRRLSRTRRTRGRKRGGVGGRQAGGIPCGRDDRPENSRRVPGTPLVLSPELPSPRTLALCRPAALAAEPEPEPEPSRAPAAPPQSPSRPRTSPGGSHGTRRLTHLQHAESLCPAAPGWVARTARQAVLRTATAPAVSRPPAAPCRLSWTRRIAGKTAAQPWASPAGETRSMALKT